MAILPRAHRSRLHLAKLLILNLVFAFSMAHTWGQLRRAPSLRFYVPLATADPDELGDAVENSLVQVSAIQKVVSTSPDEQTKCRNIVLPQWLALAMPRFRPRTGAASPAVLVGSSGEERQRGMDRPKEKIVYWCTNTVLRHELKRKACGM